MTLNIVGLFYILRFQWIDAALALASSIFLIGGVASTVRHDRSLDELANPPEPTREEGVQAISADESLLIGRAVTKLAILGWIPALILTLHQGIKWYWAVPLSLGAGFIAGPGLAAFAVGSAWLSRRR